MLVQVYVKITLSETRRIVHNTVEVHNNVFPDIFGLERSVFSH